MQFRFMKKLILSLFVLASLTMSASCSTSVSNEYFTPVQKSDLRLPSTPLLVSDPMFSFWSPSDVLTEESVEHWSAAEKPLVGAIRVDGKVYRFLGVDELNLETVVPMADEDRWEAAVSHRVKSGDWMKPEFDDTKWERRTGAFGSRGEYPNVRTPWGGNGNDIYVRRTVEISNLAEAGALYVKYSHDDVFELYLNGEKLVGTGETWGTDFVYKLTDKQKELLKEGKNVIAAHCHNTTGGAYVDFGLYKESKDAVSFKDVAVQKSCTVMATSTYYTFTCGPVDLELVFTAPQVYDDLDLLSTPINYVSYRVKANDKKEHSVQVYFETTPKLAVNRETQPTVAETLSKNGINYVKAGTIEQPICAKAADQICIDWGYAYVASPENRGGKVALGAIDAMKRAFRDNGTLAESEKMVVTREKGKMPAMAYCDDLGKVTADKNPSNFVMFGYDDVYSVEYMYELRKGYWAHDGKVTITDAFEKMAKNYNSIMDRCREVDAEIFADGEAAGGNKYAQVLAASYRQMMSAHKLFTDKDGNLLWFSKENNSNGCINTVDLTYPEAPFFLAYNPELQKAMMTSIFEYSRTGRWNKPFAAHDLGTYPIANGQVYGGDMPVEESGNMVILAAAIAKMEGNADYANKYWNELTTWTDYLVEYGLDPENQLCTDDFAGHWAHNANLSVKAIMAIQGYSELAKMLGKADVAEKYAAIAKDYANKWKEMAGEGDHYRLAFDRENTWSQKYNMVWDTLWSTGLFEDVTKTEIAYYLTKQNKYGLPLDCRKDYTKSDWIMWTAAMTKDVEEFQKIADPIYDYVNETSTRVPISDWYDTKTGRWVGFRARSVIAGHWMQVLKHKIQNQ